MLATSPTIEHQGQRAVLVAASQQGDQGGDEEGVAELNGPDGADTRADPPAGERAEHLRRPVRA